jgi:hypothetical protein
MSSALRPKSRHCVPVYEYTPQLPVKFNSRMSTGMIPSWRRVNGWPVECCVMVSTMPPGINPVVVPMCRTR